MYMCIETGVHIIFIYIYLYSSDFHPCHLFGWNPHDPHSDGHFRAPKAPMVPLLFRLRAKITGTSEWEAMATIPVIFSGSNAINHLYRKNGGKMVEKNGGNAIPTTNVRVGIPPKKKWWKNGAWNPTHLKKWWKRLGMVYRFTHCFTHIGDLPLIHRGWKIHQRTKRTSIEVGDFPAQGHDAPFWGGYNPSSICMYIYIYYTHINPW